MPSFPNCLFRRSRPPEVRVEIAVSAPTPPERARPSNPVVIPVPDGMPPELLVRVPTRQPRDPSRKRKRRTKEEIEADHKAWVEGTLRQNRVRFDFDRSRAERIGVTHYRWRTVGDYDTCKVCKARNGKQFPLRASADFQHPGFMLCVCPPIDEDDKAGEQPCRCYAEMILRK